MDHRFRHANCHHPVFRLETAIVNHLGRFGRTRSRLTRCVIGIGLAFLTGFAWAGGGALVTLPQNNKIVNGLRVTIDNRWLEGNGYRPIRVTISTATGIPATADRRIDVELSFRGQRGPMQTPIVQTSVELPEGSRSVTKVVSIPYNDSWYYCELVATEDGRYLRDVSEEFAIPRGINFFGSEALPSFLVVHSAAPTWNARMLNSTVATKTLPDLRPLVRNLITADRWGNASSVYIPPDAAIDDSLILNMINANPSVELLPPSDLPTKWIDFSGVEFIVLYRETLSQLHPDTTSALAHWMRAGGTLCIAGAGDQFERLSEFEQHFGVAPRTNRESSLPPWRTPDKAKKGALPLLELNPNGPRLPQPVAPPAPSATSLPSATDDSWKVPLVPFQFRSVGLGHMVVLANEDPFEARRDEWHWMLARAVAFTSEPPDTVWNWLLASIPRDHWMWYRKHGISLQRRNREFGNWLVAGVGKAPVLAFLVMISLFMLVIGPVNHYVLSRKRKVILLLVTVPLGAGIVTLGLFLYAILHDGLHTRARIRSYTQIDQQTGTAVSQSRQTYYAGVAPSSGLTYPADATVFKLNWQPDRSYPASTSPYLVRWTEDQVLARGFLPSRTMSQFIVTRSAVTEHTLIPSAAGEESMSVENRLGSRIQMLVVAAEDGRLFQGQAIEDGATAILSSLTEHEAQEVLRDALRAHDPAFPPEFDPDASSASPWFTVNRFGWFSDQGQPEATLAFGLMERRLRQACLMDSGTRPPRSYVAIVEQSREVPLGVENPVQQNSLQIVEGFW